MLRREEDAEREMFMSQVKAICEENLAKSIRRASSPQTDRDFERTPTPKSEAGPSDAEILAEVTELAEILGKGRCLDEDEDLEEKVEQELKLHVLDTTAIKSTGIEGGALRGPSPSYDEGNDEYHDAEEGEHGRPETEFSENDKSRPELMDLAQTIDVSTLVEMSTTALEAKQQKEVGDSDENYEQSDENNGEARAEDETEDEVGLSAEGEKWQAETRQLALAAGATIAVIALMAAFDKRAGGTRSAE